MVDYISSCIWWIIYLDVTLYGGQMREINNIELKDIELNILEYINRICIKNNIDYSISSGTLLGAVRHNGFIPWDDDIDIIMRRDQYQKFLKVVKEKLGNYSILSCYNNKTYFYPFIKVCDNRTTLIESGVNKIYNYGVYIDVFPIDAIPNTGIKSYIFFHLIIFLRYLLDIRIDIGLPRNSFKRLVWRMLKVFFGIIPINKIGIILDKMGQIYNNQNTEYATDIIWGSIPAKKIPRNIFNNYKDIEFEKRNFKSIVEVDCYLKILYGDYMKLPPKDKRISNHSFIAYWKA